VKVEHLEPKVGISSHHRFRRLKEYVVRIVGWYVLDVQHLDLSAQTVLVQDLKSCQFGTRRLNQL
jgi:hypothetical protein